MKLVIATVGECTASLGWGLYTYRLHNIPLFVPPGHALLYTMGVAIAARMPERIVWWVPVVALPYMSLALMRGFSTLDAGLFLVFVLWCGIGFAREATRAARGWRDRRQMAEASSFFWRFGSPPVQRECLLGSWT